MSSISSPTKDYNCMKIFLKKTEYEQFQEHLTVREQGYLENLCQLSFKQVHVFFKDCLKYKQVEYENSIKK